MKRLRKKQELADLLQGSKPKETLILLDEGEKVPKNHRGAVIRFVNFAKKNEKIKAGR